MTYDTGSLALRLADKDADLLGAQRLRYRVFVEELGGDGPMIDHEGRFERDEFDTLADHLVLIDGNVDVQTHDHVVGAYRLLTSEKAQAHGGFYSEGEYDLSVLENTGRRLLELGRSCVDPLYRGGVALHMLWSGLAAYVSKHDVEILFGVASLHGTNVSSLAQPLSHLYHAHLAPPELRVRTVEAAYQSMDLIPKDRIDRVAAMREVPALIKSYLRLGGFVGDGAFVDHAFNTTDVCLVIDTARMNDRAASRFTQGVF